MWCCCKFSQEEHMFFCVWNISLLRSLSPIQSEKICYWMDRTPSRLRRCHMGHLLIPSFNLKLPWSSSLLYLGHYLCITVQILIQACWKTWLFPIISLERGYPCKIIYKLGRRPFQPMTNNKSPSFSGRVLVIQPSWILLNMVNHS